MYTVHKTAKVAEVVVQSYMSGLILNFGHKMSQKLSIYFSSAKKYNLHHKRTN